MIRYADNGVWDMVAVRAKRIVYTYLCCPEPYPNIVYRLVFSRYSEFYIYYMVLPCLFLSVLSLLVFYLPPDCGEKLTLSITNLLALVVFQQIIAENMPPSADDSPVVGKYENHYFPIPYRPQIFSSWSLVFTRIPLLIISIISVIFSGHKGSNNSANKSSTIRCYFYSSILKSYLTQNVMGLRVVYNTGGNTRIQ